MNGQIIRYLALNGPSLIYSIAKDLASRSQTKVHYPTVNRRVHELVERKYVQKAGTRTTKAGAAADLYATTIRGDFAALAGMPDIEDVVELSPKEIRQMIANASFREGSPFVLLKQIIEEGQSAAEHVDRELLPEIIKAIRNGYLNLDAADEGVICSAFASIISRKVTARMAIRHKDYLPKKEHGDIIDTLMRSLEKTMASSDRPNPEKIKLTPISRQWVNELKVFLRLHSVGSD
jgi:hypothetical protein